jgi:hypothetical protein
MLSVLLEALLRLRGSLPRRAASAWYLGRARLASGWFRPAWAALSSAGWHTEPFLFFSVGPSTTYSCTTRFAPGMRERRCVGAGASTADQSDDV